MVSPEGNRPQTSAAHERFLNSLDIRDWADGILSDPELLREDSTDSTIRQMARWDTPNREQECTLWRIDCYGPKGPELQACYNLAVKDLQKEDTWTCYRLGYGGSDPEMCDVAWDRLPERHQNRQVARQEMLRYLRTSPVDTTTMRTRLHVATAFWAIARKNKRFGRKALQTALKEPRNINLVEGLFDADDDAES